VISYLVYTTLLRAAIGDSILGDHQKSYDDFLDIFLNGVLMAKRTYNKIRNEKEAVGLSDLKNTRSTDALEAMAAHADASKI
jgi:hypothetical protein